MATGLTIAGIDPAPSKPSVVCRGGTEFESVPAQELPDSVAKLTAHPGRLLIAWDAPLSFDSANGYSDRPVDRETRAWVRKQVQAGRLETGAVSVQPFTGCPHWAITCAALGMPFGDGPAGLQLATDVTTGDKLVVEVHPAVALARWWRAADLTEPFPKYKGINRAAAEKALATIRRALGGLGIPERAAVDDDHLDAWVAWRLVSDFARGPRRW